ncbi:hypothetical protein [Agreia sp. COWG]|uniref:hypothetical protein n=1 Tax=Agreia sp. COWG TaxID=2773266 RepID=UPI00192763EF|nr:hypothetical protein [Agreia sp. COWG]CAD5996378.1 conserved protein of unknown function [Agreia sp. COWG]
MTLSPDEQPLTRRQLRELERTMPKKDRQDPTKVAEEAARRASEPAVPPVEETVAPEQQSHASDAEEVVEDAVVVEEPQNGVAQPASVERADASDEESSDSGPVSSFAPHDDEPQQIVEELVIDDATPENVSVTTEPSDSGPAGNANAGDAATDTTTIDDVPIDDDPEDGNAVTEITVEPLSSGPILAPIFQPPVVPPTQTSPAKIDDADASFDDLISSRTVGSTNSSQTSALVLPAVPSSMDMGTALDETGEVIITGSIDLPMSMGASGAPAAGIESKDLDSLLDAGESEQVDGDVAPVSASRAVSTGASNNALVAPPKRGRANVPVVLAITAGVLAIGVVGILIAAFVFKIF